ncbi:unnamed protein product [Danaus chrysippus]|uniref:(African queen) hypothetical protein n=1 Tax=Danaus chrysippus TaxID=151541 RepID=A0A8J2QCB1_9NEOP|nr:unnamed protein product [Danaus chrysippus]
MFVRVDVVTDEDLLALHSVYGPVLQRAFDIFEKHPTLETYSTANKTRILIEIKGDSDRCYRIFPKLNFCPCKAYKHQVLEQQSQVTCKHVLAGRIACILNKTVDKLITDEQYLMLVKSMFDFDHNG